MRTFQYSDEKSHKFWNIELSGNDVTVTYGRVGSAGTTQTKTFKDAAAAQKEHDKLVKEKTGKGYTETGAAAARPSGSLREALERALVENPDDTASHMAYADHLTESGDPFGEFVQVQLALEDESLPPKRRTELKAREKKLLDTHGATWLGELAPELDKPLKEEHGEHQGGCLFTHVRGWLDTLEIGRLTVNVARLLAKAPQMRLLRTLRIYAETMYEDERTSYEGDTYEPGPDVPEDCENPSLYPLLKSPYLGNVRVLQVGETAGPDDKDTYYSCYTNADGVLGLIKKMPKLEELYLTAHNVDTTQLFGLKTLNALRILQVYHLHRYPLDLLAKNPSLSKLTTLMFHPHGPEEENAYIRLPGLRAILNSPHLKSLTHIHIHLHDVGDKGCEEIVKSGALERLKVLDLAWGNITDDGARTLAKSTDLKNLEYLDLRKNTLSKDGIAALKATGVKLIADNQWTRTGDEYGDKEYLNEGDIE